MLRITALNDGSAVRFRVEGKLAEASVSELRTCWEATVVEKRDLVVNLTGVTFVDLQGKALLAEMYAHGTRIQARGLMTEAIIEEIQQGMEVKARLAKAEYEALKLRNTARSQRSAQAG